MFNRVDYADSLPGGINTHQLMHISQAIHEVVSQALPTDLSDKPQHHAVSVMLDAVQRGMDQLDQGHNRRKYKQTSHLRAVGDASGKTGEQAIGPKKRQAYDKRRGLLTRLRLVVGWRLADLAYDKTLPAYLAAQRLNELIYQRVDHFERASYQESATEFEYFFKSVDQQMTMAELKAIEVYGLYQQLKRAQEDFGRLRDDHIRQIAELDRMPRVKAASRDLRYAIRSLLSFLHFDIAYGDDTFRTALAVVDELIGKAGSVAAKRETMKERSAAVSPCDKQ